MWGVALTAMTGSCSAMGVLWLLYALIRPMDLKSKDATKDMKLGLSDEEVSSEEGASDLATGTLVCSSVCRDPAVGWAAGRASASPVSNMKCVGVLLGCPIVHELVLHWSVLMQNAVA